MTLLDKLIIKIALNILCDLHLTYDLTQTLDRQTNNIRGATGAARAPKPGKTPRMAACRRCRCLLFFKIKVRPRSCRSYPIWRP